MKWILPLAILTGFVFVIALSAKGPNPDARPTAEDVAGRTMSPFCPGLTVDECPSSQSADLRNRIAVEIDRGATNEQIDKWLVENYGTAVLGRPKSNIVWMVPAAVTTIAMIALGLGIRKWSGP
ncbi:MAG: cytochrome c-type biogenesis protein CcmH [Actinomycetota bacterium]